MAGPVSFLELLRRSVDLALGWTSVLARAAAADSAVGPQPRFLLRRRESEKVLPRVSSIARWVPGLLSVSLDTDRLLPPWEHPQHANRSWRLPAARERCAVLICIAFRAGRCIFGDSNGRDSLEVGGEGTVGIEDV